MNDNIQIVTKDNVPLRAGSMAEAWQKGLYHQIVRVILTDGKKSVLLQKRGPEMEVYPNRWTDSASGHVDFQEAPDAAARRELSEELGVVTPLNYVTTFLTKYRVDDKEINTFNLIYTGKLNQNTHLAVDTHEVADTKWVRYSELISDLENDTQSYTPYLREIICDHGGQLLAG